MLPNMADSRTQGRHGPAALYPDLQWVLCRLGFALHGPTSERVAAARRLLPDAAGDGAVLFLAQADRCGAIPRTNPAQREWLAERLVFECPTCDDPWPWWESAWKTACCRLAVDPPESLGVEAKAVVLADLASSGAEDTSLADALESGVRKELGLESS